MNRTLFESMNFNDAMDILCEEKENVTTYEILKDFIKKCIDEENNHLAIFLLTNIYNSYGNSEYYYYDYSMGTLCKPVCLNTIEDVEEIIGFDL